MFDVGILRGCHDAASEIMKGAEGEKGSSWAVYSYLANSPLVEYVNIHNDGQTRMTTSKQYDLLNRLMRMALWQGTSVASVVNENKEYCTIEGLTYCDVMKAKMDDMNSYIQGFCIPGYSCSPKQIAVPTWVYREEKECP